MQAFVAVSMVVVFLILVVIPSDVESQRWKPCRHECVPGRIPHKIKFDAKAPKLTKQINGLESKNKKAMKKKHGCPGKTCPRKWVKLVKCGKCYVVWPFKGITAIACRPRKCPFNRRCRLYSPAFRWVVLYCPRQTPKPWVFKKVRVCTNCCCLP